MKAKDLKNSILQMAIEGKLVPQDPNDEPASALLERIREEKHKLIAEGKAKFPKGGESIIYIGSDDSPYEKRVDAKGRVLSNEYIADEVPFDIPESWEWARLDMLTSILNGDRGRNYPAKSKLHESGIPFVSAINIDGGLVTESNMLYLDEAQYEALRAGRLQKGDSVFCIRGSLGKHGVFPFEKGAIASSLAIIRPISTDALCEAYLELLFDSPLTFLGIKRFNNGTAQPNLAARDFGSFLYPLPPLAEQRRIVERVDELVPLVEKYGELEDAREKLDGALPARLRKSVLQEAVQGKLVPQDPSDEPAAALLERIREQRRLLVAEKKMKAPKGGESVIYTGSDGRRYEKRVDAKGRESEPSCIEDEIPFDIPETWAWARLGSIVYSRGQKKPTSDFCYIDISSIDNENQKLGSEDTILKAAKAPSRARKIVARGDVLYATVRPYLHNACVIDRDFKFEPIASTGFAALSCPQGLDSCYLLNYLVSPRFDEYANDNENSKGVAYPAINDARLYRALVPIPPINEQKRIVEKLRVVLTNQ